MWLCPGSKQAATPARLEEATNDVQQARHYRKRRGEEAAEDAEPAEQRPLVDKGGQRRGGPCKRGQCRVSPNKHALGAEHEHSAHYAGPESNGADRQRVEAEPSARQNGAAAAAPPREAEGGRATRDRQHPPPRAEREGARPGAWRDVMPGGTPAGGTPAGAPGPVHGGTQAGGTPAGGTPAGTPGRMCGTGGAQGRERARPRQGRGRAQRPRARQEPGPRGAPRQVQHAFGPHIVLLVPAGGSAFALETCHSSSTREALAYCRIGLCSVISLLGQTS